MQTHIGKHNINFEAKFKKKNERTIQYIFNTAKANSPLSLHGLQHKLSQSFEELQYLARLSNSVEAFKKNWLRWQPVYTSFS